MTQQRTARMVWIIDGNVVMPEHDGPNRTAAERLVAHHRSLGQIEASDEALTQLVVTIAEACDCDPSNAALWNQYRRALDDLRSRCSTEGQSDIDKLLAQLVADDSSTTVRNTTKRKPAKSSASDRTDRSDSWTATDATPKTRRRSGNGNASGRDSSV